MSEEGPEIRQRMEVVGSDGQHVGTVDRLERGRIKLTREDDPGRAGEHRSVPLGLVAVCEGNQVRLSLTGQEARALAVGGLEPWEVVEDATVPAGGDQGLAERAAGTGAGVPDDGGTRGVRGGVGTGGAAHGEGTGSGGTSSHGSPRGGGGITDDPNMDPGAGRGSPR